MRVHCVSRAVSRRSPALTSRRVPVRLDSHPRRPGNPSAPHRGLEGRRRHGVESPQGGPGKMGSADCRRRHGEPSSSGKVSAGPHLSNPSGSRGKDLSVQTGDAEVERKIAQKPFPREERPAEAWLLHAQCPTLQFRRQISGTKCGSKNSRPKKVHPKFTDSSPNLGSQATTAQETAKIRVSALPPHLSPHGRGPLLKTGVLSVDYT